MTQKEQMTAYTGISYWWARPMLWLGAALPFVNIVVKPSKRASSLLLIALFIICYIVSIVIWWMNDRVFVPKTNRKRLLRHSLLTNATPRRLIVPIIIFILGLLLDIVSGIS